MTALYGHAWVSAHGVSATKPPPDDGALTIDGETWRGTLAGITGQQFAAGLSACVTEGGEFPPSAPRFRAMCLGIPSLAKVKREWNEWRASPFTRLVHEHLDGWLYRQSPADKADRLLREAYESAREHVMAGGALPDEPVALIEADEPKPITPASRETVAKHVEEIGELLGNAGASCVQEEGQA